MWYLLLTACAIVTANENLSPATNVVLDLDNYGNDNTRNEYEHAPLKDEKEIESSTSGQCSVQPPSPVNGYKKCTAFRSCKVTCSPGYRFPQGEAELEIECVKEEEWKVQSTNYNAIPNCAPACEPQCENGGVCEAPYRCKCPDGFWGSRCQYLQNKLCPGTPNLVANARQHCTSNTCTVICQDDFTFPDGSTRANVLCKDGEWIPAGQKWANIPDCQPECKLPCKNGGVCLPSNECECPQGFRGPLCQYNEDACSSEKLGFNGIIDCTESPEAYECKLSCPVDWTIEFPPADSYVCRYANGTFEPPQVPQCRKITRREIVNVVNDYENTASSRVPEPGSCFTWAGVHYKTFDGKIYSFESNCTYTLLKEIQDDLFSVAIQTDCQHYSSSVGVNCPRSLRIFIRGEEFILSRGSGAQPELRTPDGKKIPLPAQLPSMTVGQKGKFVKATLDAVGLKIKWDGDSLIQVDAAENLWNRTAGLCGSFDGDRDNDFDASGSKESFVKQWKLEDFEDKCVEISAEERKQDICDPKIAPEAEEFCKSLMSDERYSKCGDTEEFESACLRDYCKCDSPHGNRSSCACETLAVYVRQCAHRGVVSMVGWRDQKVCPMECSNGKVYMACGPNYQASCGNTEQFANSEQSCEEGCFCPEGLVLLDGACVAPEQCPCRLRGKDFEPGAKVPKDCNTCACVRGSWTCTETPCAGKCSAVGDPHYTTFDGKRYDFMGKCTYYLVKGDNYSVEAENTACLSDSAQVISFVAYTGDDQPSCTKTVTIRADNTIVKLKQNREITVNGEDVKNLPMMSGQLRLRATSSLFVSVELPNGLEVLWDGVSRVYVNAPASLRGKTKGLCGTFTSNQKEDFLTPDGDVENSVVAFANKWKTDELCEDVKEVATHPCDANPQKRAAAESHCSALKKKLFSECHWHVDPEPYYKDCLYDMCECQASVEYCLCVTLANYAKDCAQIGVLVPWRQEVPECPISCPGNQEYQICGNSCTRSCADISLQRNCTQECVEGCNCPKGKTLNSNGECIPIGLCPCTHNSLEFQAGYREVRSTPEGHDLCTCAGGLWNCRPAVDEEINEYPEVAKLQDQCDIDLHLELSTCEPAVPRTCRNMHQEVQHSPSVCRPGCVCEAGYVLDAPSGSCVEEKECPCYHGGRSYQEGASIQADCNSCVCYAGQWNCTKNACPGVCSVWGDSHYTTFDDRKYEFQGACDYVLAKGRINDVESFALSVKNVACGTTGVTCSKSIALAVGKSSSSSSSQEAIVLTRGKAFTLDTLTRLERIHVRRAGLFVFLEVPDLGVVVQWDEGTRIYVRVDTKWRGKTRGLCGDFNDNAEDDFKTPSGGVPEVSARLFGDSWKLNVHCAEPADESLSTRAKHPERELWAIQRCRIMKSEMFEACHSEIAPDDYVERCIYDACGCDTGGDCECLCTAIAAYAHKCNARGINIKWRSQKLCPMQCDLACSSYTACMSTCPLETCDNLVSQGNSLRLCEADACIEGCQPHGCPEGQVYLNSSYTKCVPRDSCRPVCQVIEGVTYIEGDQVPSDQCQSCFCTKGKIICSGRPCVDLESETRRIPDNVTECVAGWSDWFDKDAIVFRPETDVESSPLIDVRSFAPEVCSGKYRTKIECRTADEHVPHMELIGLQVSCDLNNGVSCSPNGDLTCPDFETRVYCECEENNVTTTTTPYPEVEGDIRRFTPAPEKCEPGEHWSKCAVKCGKTCEYFGYILKKQGFCNETRECIAGCVKDNQTECTSGYWRDAYTCVERSHCMCKSRGGKAILPGTVHKESHCKTCQCINNFYTCEDTCERDVRVVVVPKPPTIEDPVDTLIGIITSTPPRKCDEDQEFTWFIEDNPFEVALNASSFASDDVAPSMIRLQRTKTYFTWQPAIDDTKQWVEFRLEKPQPVYGIILGGDPNTDKFVTSYRVLYSEDGWLFSYLMEDGEPKIVSGPVESGHRVRVIFREPIEAKAVRINPVSWHGGIAMQAELVGCASPPEEQSFIVVGEVETFTEEAVEPICNDEMGYNNKNMSEQQVTVSSSFNNTLPNLRLSSETVWRPALDSPDQYVQFDFLEPRNITGVETMGGNDTWITTYKVQYSSDGKNWNPLLDENGDEDEFLGNVDDINNKINYFKKPIGATQLRIYPTGWHEHIGLKVEVRGCFIPYPAPEDLPEPLPESSAALTVCNVCNGIMTDNIISCPCPDSMWWDGAQCVVQHRCPCRSNGWTYAVGSSFQNHACEECLCALGGVPVCQPKSCPSCSDGLRPVVTELCACLCMPCPSGQRLCPTSDVCIDESKWCNGVQDCPDDEVDCVVAATTKIIKHTSVKVECQSECPPGFDMVPMNASASSDSDAGYNVIIQQSESYKKSTTIKFSSRFAEDEQEDEADKPCPKFMCKSKFAAPDGCHKVTCPEGFQAMVDFTNKNKRSATCNEGCVPIPPAERVCSLSGRTFVTFDGVEYKYDICDHLMARSLHDNRWYIIVEKLCEDSKDLLCHQSIVAGIDSHEIFLSPDMSAIVDGNTYQPEEVVHLGDKNPDFKVSRVGNALRLDVRKYPFWILLESNGNVKIGVSVELNGHVDGLCGFMDGLPDDDLQTPEGNFTASTQEFGDSWKTSDTAECKLQTCPESSQMEAWKVCSAIRDSSFAGCDGALNRERYVTSCLENTCSCISRAENNNTAHQECRCQALEFFVNECLNADRNVDLSTWRTIHDCPAACEAPFVHQDCFRNKCEMSCENLKQTDPCPAINGSCVSGCFCPDGMVRSGDTCVPASKCRDCVCDALGDSKYISFDRKNILFSGNCSYVLSRGSFETGNKPKYAYEVLITNSWCDDHVCTEILTVLHKNHLVQIKKGNRDNKLIGSIDMKPINSFPYNNSWVNVQTTSSSDVKLEIPSLQLEVLIFQRNFAVTLRVPSYTFGGKMEGICGDCDDDPDNDLKLHIGNLTDDVNEFGESWRLKTTSARLGLSDDKCHSVRKNCPDEPADDRGCSELLKNPVFTRCHNLIDPLPYYKTCKDSLCQNGDVCVNLEAYARSCMQAGICVEWRNHQFCPMKCPHGLEYQACKSGCSETCESLKSNDNKCSEGLAEGCFCPRDKVWHEGECLTKNRCYPCDNQGHVSGDTWQTDKCTTCTCEGSQVKCETAQCPALDTICDSNSNALSVPGTEDDCCPKFYCAPAPRRHTECGEPQLLDCGFAQTLKLAHDANQCPKFICECVSEEQCIEYDKEWSIKNEPLEIGFVVFTNTTGCCPRKMKVCQPDTCPQPEDCPKHYNAVARDDPNTCCPKYDCELPANLCTYNMIDGSVVVKGLDDSWYDGKCKKCTCGIVDNIATPNCEVSRCTEVENHPDNEDYILEVVYSDTECCPQFKRIGCKVDNNNLMVGQRWQPDSNDLCIMGECSNDTLVHKRVYVNSCQEICELGSEYQPSSDKSLACCGRCVPVACVLPDGSLRSPGDVWQSLDYCVTSTCLLVNDSLQVVSTTTTCDDTDPDEEKNYVLERQRIPEKCCLDVIRTACYSSDGQTYKPGETWISSDNVCIREFCENNDKGIIEKHKETKTCNTNCPKGWEYVKPNSETCCGECKQTHCIVEGSVYKPGQTWYSEDNCTTYSCTDQIDQLLISTSSEICPDISCSEELMYREGCCMKCKKMSYNIVEETACAAEVFDFEKTVGIIVEQKGHHGICKNLEPIKGLTECQGHCFSSTHFNNVTLNQETDCKCCQPVDFRHINVDLTCEDGKHFKKKIIVPAICSCENCQSSSEDIFRVRNKSVISE